MGSTYKLSAVQENSRALKYSADWKRQTLAGAYGGSVDYARAAGKTATLSFTGFQVAWVSTQGATRGSATVKLDARAASTVSTHASSTRKAEIVDTVLGVSGSRRPVSAVPSP